MATFESRIHQIELEPHPNADRLELAVIGGYRCVVQKGQFLPGELVAYIPEGAIVPDDVIAELGLEGRLAGPDMNRVKAIRLRGALSQGLVYPIRGWRLKAMPGLGYQEGDDVTEALGIVKYEPPIPVHMQGEVESAFGMTLNYDIEDVKKFPDVLFENEPVQMTEKIHGTWCCLGWHPDHGPIVTSKGMSAQGLVLKLNEANEDNLYVRAWHAHRATLARMLRMDRATAGPFYVLGELFGPGVQSLHYGAKEPEFRVFDVYIGEPGKGSYCGVYSLRELVAGHFQLVPTLYEGPFSHEKMMEVTDGQTTMHDATHVREGVVIKPLAERRDVNFGLGRVILKSVSGDYLVGKRKRRRKRRKK